jgi:peptidoglycan/xylan/chitin deacetylase (PgdA/CDA1 family)
LCVTPTHFAEQLEVICKNANPISLSGLIQGLEVGNLPPRSIVLTFDDGYHDVISDVMPLLERYEVPATTYIVTGYLGRAFWWDELEHIISQPVSLPERLTLTINGDIKEWLLDESTQDPSDTATLNNRHQFLISIYNALSNLSPQVQRSLLQELWSWVNTTNTKVSSRSLSSGEIVKLAKNELVTIGSHSINHSVLADLSIDDRYNEVVQSKAHLEDILGQSVTDFSYPNGSTPRGIGVVVKRAGYLSGCASVNDVAWVGSDPYQLPRFWVGDWDGEKFNKWLDIWLR